MHFDVADVQRILVGMPEDPLEDGSLVAFVGPCNGIRLATMVRVCSRNDAKDVVIVCLGVLEPLENDSSNSICSAVAAGPIIKRVAVTYKMMSRADLE